MKKKGDTKSKAYLIPYPVETFSKPILIAPQRTYLGRDPNDGIKIAGTKVSRRHALIGFEDEGYYLEDLESQNGTFLNNRRITKAGLKHHDKITIGNRTFIFLLQPGTIGDLLMDPSIAATDTIAISEDDIDLSGLWAQNAEYAAREFIQKSVHQTDDAAQPDNLAHHRLSLLYQLSEKLRSAKDIESIYVNGLDLIMEAIPAADCALIVSKTLSDESFSIAALKLRDEVEIQGNAIPVSRTLFDWVLTEKVTFVSRNVSEDLRFRDSDSIRIHNLSSIVCAPMIRMGKVDGLLYAVSNSVLEPMSQEDAAFASAIANELALNIDNIRLQQIALKNERMAAVGLTVSNLAHNIKNLIALNQSAVQLMDMHVKELQNPRIEKNWEWIQQSFSGINRLSVSMLQYVKEDEFQLRPVDINKTVLRSSKSLEHSLSHNGLQIEYHLSKQNPIWTMDEDHLQRALLNLVINAADAVKGKSKPRIGISTSVGKNGRLAISVVDNGQGFQPQNKEKLLDLFFTTKGTRGTGLGLPMVQKFVEKLGGKLVFNSKEGTGSIFKMIFPRT